MGYSHNQGLRDFWLWEYFYGKGLESPNFLTLAIRIFKKSLGSLDPGNGNIHMA
jgi:hypothetical protein